MTDNKTARAKISYLIVRNQVHEMAFGKALETLGVDWGQALTMPKMNAERYPEVKKLYGEGVHQKQHHFRIDGSELSKIFQGESPFHDGINLEETANPPTGVPIPAAPERPGKFSPGLDPELLAMVQATAEQESARSRSAPALSGRHHP